MWGRCFKKKIAAPSGGQKIIYEAWCHFVSLKVDATFNFLFYLFFAFVSLEHAFFRVMDLKKACSNKNFQKVLNFKRYNCHRHYTKRVVYLALFSRSRTMKLILKPLQSKLGSILSWRPSMMTKFHSFAPETSRMQLLR